MSRTALIVASTCCLLLALGLFLADSAAAALVALVLSVGFDLGFVRSLLAERRKAEGSR